MLDQANKLCQVNDSFAHFTYSKAMASDSQWDYLWHQLMQCMALSQHCSTIIGLWSTSHGLCSRWRIEIGLEWLMHVTSLGWVHLISHQLQCLMLSHPLGFQLNSTVLFLQKTTNTLVCTPCSWGVTNCMGGEAWFTKISIFTRPSLRASLYRAEILHAAGQEAQFHSSTW